MKIFKDSSVITAIIALILVGATSLFLSQPGSRSALAQGRDKTYNHETTGDVEGKATSTAFGVAADSQIQASGIEVIPIGAFRNDGDSVDGWFNSFAEGFIQNNSSDFYACFMAPVYPPDGASLTEFRISIFDNTAALDLSLVQLKRVAFATGAVDIVAGGSGNITWSDPTAVELAAPITSGTENVSNAYAYYAHLCFPPASDTNILFYGARLFFTN